PWFWLRDNCRCASCVNQDTMQRNFNTFDIPADIKATEALSEEAGVRVKWSDGHESFYRWEFIVGYINGLKPTDLVTDFRRAYFGAEIANSPPEVTYSSVMSSSQGVGALTAKIMKHGFAFVTETPHEDPADTQRLLERIAFIRHTHYGGFYDFTPDLAMADTAYTNLALPAHTDTTYFTDPAGLQSFHLLSHTPAPGADPTKGAEGGKSLLVDGFHAAKILKKEDPGAFKVLISKGVLWHASGNKGISIAPYRRCPVIEGNWKHIKRIRWNNDDRGVLPLDRPNERNPITAVKWYDAARKWDAILRRKEMECWIQLEPGKVLIFDNWRVLHGRSAFEGIRRICGGYINRDDFISRWKNTNFSPDQVHDSVRG
ncbi:putative Trimethyllysine dioxygenase, partial [Cladorrhinum sp. PSN332]